MINSGLRRIQPVQFLRIAVLAWACLLGGPAARAAADPDYVCHRLDRPPQIDGNLADWPSLPLLVIGRQDQVGRGHWNGPGDCRAAIRLGWDAAALYFAIDVSDDQVVQDFPDDRAYQMHKWDAIQWAIDISAAGGQGYDRDDYEYGFSRSVSGPCVYRSYVGTGLVLGRTDEVDLAVTHKPDGSGIIYEARVPFEQLVPLRPEPGRVIGFSILVQDHDAKGRTTLEWRSGISSGKNPGEFGRLLFSDATAASSEAPVYIAGRTEVTDQPSELQVLVPVRIEEARATWTLRNAAGQVADTGTLRARSDAQGGMLFLGTLQPQSLPPGKYVWSAALTGKGRPRPLRSQVNIERINVEQIPLLRAEIEALSTQLGVLIKRAEPRTIETAYADAVLAVAEVFDPITERRLGQNRHLLALRNYRVVRDGLVSEIALLESQLAEGPREFRRIPRQDMAGVTIRDGEFYVGRDPVLLVGPMGWLWGLRRDWDKFARLGFNSVRVGMSATHNYGADGLFKPMAQIPWFALRGCVQLARSSNQALSAAPFLPSAILGALARRDARTLPDFRKEYERYLDTWFGKMGTGHFLSYGIAVEGQRPRIEFSAAEHLPAYQRWLQDEYRDINAYNRTCGTDFADFALIDFPAEDETVYARRYDRAAFRQQLCADTLRWCADQIRKRDPQAEVGGYPSFLTFDDEADFWSWDLDPELDLAVYDICDADTGGPRMTADYAISTMHWLAMYRDLMGGLAPGKPQFDSEFHFANERCEYAPGFVPAIYFQTYLHGLSGSHFWVWVDSETIGTAVLLEARICLELAHTALNLRRLAPEIVAFHRQPAEVALLFSHASGPVSPAPPSTDSPGTVGPVRSTHVRQMRIAYEGLFFEGVKIGFISERRAARGDFGDCKLLIVPAAIAVTDNAVAGIEAFSRKGGSVLLVGDCFSRDHRGRERPLDDSAGCVRRPAFPDAAAARTVLAEWLTRLKLRPSVRLSVGETPRPVVEWRHTRQPKGKGDLLYVLNTGHSPADISVSDGNRLARGTDLISGRPFTGKEILPSLGLRLVRLQSAGE